MKNFIWQLRRRMRIQIFFMVLIAICVGAGSTLYSFQLSGDSWVSALQLGLFLIIEGLLLFRTIFLWQTLKSVSRLKVLYEKESQISQGTRILRTELLILAWAAVIAGFFDQMVFFTLLGAVGFVFFYRVFLEVQYQSKKKLKNNG